jgi:D-xylose transport system permease protein
MLSSAAIGAIQGTIITRLHLPSFVVTLAGLLGWGGFLIFIFDLDKGSVGGVLNITNNVIYNLVNGDLSPIASWIVLAALVGLFALTSITKTTRRRSRGLSAPPMSITIMTIVVTAAAGIALVVVCNLNRGVLGVTLSGVPYVVPFVLAVIIAWTWLLGRTRIGRYIYAIGASPEAARRAGINVAWIRTLAFTLSGFTAGLAGIVYESRLGSISVGFDGGTYVLYAVAAAVIGGTSLLGGRGKAIHPLLGGLVIAVVTNGLALLNFSTAGTEMATALVLLIAVTVDSLVRRRNRASTT